MNILARTIDGIQEILAICPCCGHIFRLVEGKFIFPEKPAESCFYLDLVSLENKVSVEDQHLNAAEERFEAALEQQKEVLWKRAQKRAKRRLKKIDPVFSARNIDPQDAKLIFDPVEYVIFHGLSSERVQNLEFVIRHPNSKRAEVTTNSIIKSIKNGDVSFELLRMKNDGSFERTQA